ncbi:MAG: thiamine phosphate synthase [Spirochaetaceae bacterium]|jgi:thiamine-phosphate pyrophosphorylase|nr:thiamine phosphate synthase [Spirochaetaceae bacterium]
MLDPRLLRLYLCAGSALTLGRPLDEAVAAAIAGGVTMVQLREKDASGREFYERALSVRRITEAGGVPLVINDRLDVALGVGAAGLHIGQHDIPVEAARRVAGNRLFIGVSVGTVAEALRAQAGGADYLGAGAVFPTGSKADAGDAIGVAALGAICSAVRIPVVAIGGICPGNAGAVLETGAAGIAVISAILSQSDIKSAASAAASGSLRLFQKRPAKRP